MTKQRFYILNCKTAPMGESGESVKNNYSLDKACKHCGVGVEFKNCIYVKGLKKITKDYFYTLDGDGFISLKFFNFLLDKKIKLQDLLSVKNLKEDVLPFYMLHTKFSLPQMSNLSIGYIRDEVCPICQKNGYFSDAYNDKDGYLRTKPIHYIYQGVSSEFLSQSDLFYSWEHYGYSSLVKTEKYVVRFARPTLIVSEKFKNAFEEFGIKKMEFLEVFFED